jgi:hypothetical protein
MKQLLFALLILFAALPASAQETGDIKGMVVARTTRQPLHGAKVTLRTPQETTVYTTGGAFALNNIPEGQWELTVEAPDYLPVRLPVNVTRGATTEINLITLAPDAVAVADFEMEELDTDFGDAGQDLPVTLSAGRDVYESVANYKFGALRFRNRGYENSAAKVYLNGVYMNDAQSGYSSWSLWGGLNDATRNQENSSNLAVPDFGTGSINGATNILATASQLRQGLRVSAVHSSRQYLFRGMVTYASGENENGWSYAFSGSTRQGGNLWVNGAGYNAWSYFGAVEKRLNTHHRLALTFFGAPTIRDAQGASTQEVYDLVNSHYYNPNWGYQNGEKRNARVRNNHEPVVMLNYTWDINEGNRLLAGLSYRFGRSGYSALDWYDAQDPRPDYYRNLPSYYSRPSTPGDADPLKAAYLAEGWRSDWNVRQINWDALYDINRHSYFDPADGAIAGTDGTTRRSKYVIEERRTDQQDVRFNLQWNLQLTDHLKLIAGYDFRRNRTEYFKVIKDLLGGDYWLDIDQFAERDFGDWQSAQNDLNNPDRIVGTGDKYGYDYFSYLHSESLRAALRYHIGQWESYAAFERGYTTFYRDGQYRKGLFPDNSFGKSEEPVFQTYSAKIGGTFKLSGSHVFRANLAYITEAPYFQRAMVSPRTRNDFIPGLTTEKTAGADLSYALRLPGIQLRVTGYYTSIKDQTDIISFYDDLNRTYSNFSMRGIDQRHAGVEAGVEVPLIHGISLKSALSYGHYRYTSNPKVTVTADNGSNSVFGAGADKTVYWKNYKVSGTPQTAFDIGLDYRSPRNLFLGIDVAYYDANYISMNPLRRTDEAITVLSQNLMNAERDLRNAQTPESIAAAAMAVDLASRSIRTMTKQEKFPAAFILNANIGKMWYLGKYTLGVNLDAQNLLNNTGIKSGGYEQMRLARDTTDENNIIYSPFDSKYYYLFGASYYLNVYFRF